MALLQHALIPTQFPSRVIAPLQAGHKDQVKDYVTEIISCTGPSWAGTGSQTAPDDAAIQELPRSTQDALPTWVDKLYLKIAHLAALLAEAQDSPQISERLDQVLYLVCLQWPQYPCIDTHTGEIVNTNTFTLVCHGLTQALNDEFIRGIVAKDNLRGRNRFQLGTFAPGKTSASSQLVIRLTPPPSLGASNRAFLHLLPWPSSHSWPGWAVCCLLLSIQHAPGPYPRRYPP